MAKQSSALRKLKAFMVLPICLLVLNAVEEVVIYKLQKEIDDENILTVILLVMFVAGFAAVAAIAVPWTKRILHEAHRGSEQKAGAVGVIIMYVVLAAVLFFAYRTIYVMGPEFLLPTSWW